MSNITVLTARDTTRASNIILNIEFLAREDGYWMLNYIYVNSNSH